MLLPVKDCRTISKKELLHNGARPQIDLNPENYDVKVDGVHITFEPLSEPPLALRHFLF